MLKIVLFPFFLFRLIWVISPTLVRLALAPTKSYQAMAFSLVALGLMLPISFSLSPTLLGIQQAVSLPIIKNEIITTAEIEQQLSRYSAIYEVQPTHRDVLFNMSLLYSVLGDSNTANYYRSQARYSDPNHGFFK